MKKFSPAFAPAILMTLLAACSVSLASCKKKEAAQDASVEASQSEEPAAPAAGEGTSAAVQAAASGIAFDFMPLSGDYHTDAHAAYLKDPFAFARFEDAGVPEGGKAYLLVASNEARLYGPEAFNFDSSKAEIILIRSWED